MVAIINCGSSKSSEFQRILNKFDLESILVPLQTLDSFVPEDHDAIIISGAPLLLTQIPQKPYLDQFSFLTEYDSPVLGVCFGHQILGLLDGATIYQGEEVRRLQEIEIESNSLFNSLPNKVMFLQDHIEYITMPSNYDLIATSNTGVNEGMVHKTKLHYGIQFHPECSDENGEILLKNFARLVKNYLK